MEEKNNIGKIKQAFEDLEKLPAAGGTGKEFDKGTANLYKECALGAIRSVDYLGSAIDASVLAMQSSSDKVTKSVNGIIDALNKNTESMNSNAKSSEKLAIKVFWLTVIVTLSAVAGVAVNIFKP